MTDEKTDEQFTQVTKNGTGFGVLAIFLLALGSIIGVSILQLIQMM
jgi:hypothetical protein